jgi:hypothetical protein
MGAAVWESGRLSDGRAPAVLYETENGTQQNLISNAWGGRDLCQVLQ